MPHNTNFSKTSNQTNLVLLSSYDVLTWVGIEYLFSTLTEEKLTPGSELQSVDELYPR